jgi:hypothetical protein
MGTINSIPLHELTFQNFTLDDLAKIFTIIALILAGLGAYYKFIKGRVYTIRLEANVLCHIVRQQTKCDLIVVSALKNVGFSRVRIEQRGTGLRLLEVEPETAPTIVHKVKWRPLATFAVFEDHQYLGANESIEDQQLIAIPESGSQKDLRVELWVTSQGAVWKAFNIVRTEEKADLKI